MMGDMARTERRFVIVTPHQSVGKPGTEVSASQLHMTDEQLDDWVDAGHGREIHQMRSTAVPPAAVSKVTRRSSKDDDDGASKD